jgi:hypothetical protein
VKETTAWALPAVAETLVGAVGVPPPRDEDVPSIGISLFYLALPFATCNLLNKSSFYTLKLKQNIF